MPEYSGYKRSLFVSVTKYNGGEVVDGYPKNYPTSADTVNGYFTFEGVRYYIPKESELSYMSASTYNDLVAVFEAYVESIENVSFDNDEINQNEEYDPIECDLNENPPTTTTIEPTIPCNINYTILSHEFSGNFATIRYTLTSGSGSVMVELIGSAGVVGTNVEHTIPITNSFTNVPIDDDYQIVFTDLIAPECSRYENLSWCKTCEDGYIPVGDECVYYDVVDPIYYTTTYEIIKKSENSSFGLYGAILFNNWDYDGTGDYYRFNLNNSFWTNLPYPSLGGPMNRSSVWSSVMHNYQDIAFSFCVDIAKPKTYYIGYGCDNIGKLMINSKMVFEQDITALATMFYNNGHPIGGLKAPNLDPTNINNYWIDRISFRYWYIYPMHLPAGKNVIEAFGHQITIDAGVAIQIYDATPYDLENVTSNEELSQYKIFDTLDLVGTSLHYEYSASGGYHGYVCPSGYSLNTCVEPFTCVKIDRIPCYTGETSYVGTWIPVCVIEEDTTTTTLEPIIGTTTTTLEPCITEEVSCGCNVSFDTYENNTNSVLNVGNLIGDSCLFDEYVIDWYKDGEYYMSSGKGSDPSISAYHPFTGDSAIPVVAGTYVPVLVWTKVTGGDGSKIYSGYTECEKWCSYSGVLPTIDVLALNCGVSNRTGDYQYYINYTTSQDYSEAERTFTWDLNESTVFMGIYFQGYTVADKIEVYFKDSTTPIQQWVIGSSNNYNNDTVEPYSSTWQNIRFMIEVPAYEAGNYLTFKITPSIRETNTNTAWRLDLQCLDASYEPYTDCVALSNYDRSIDPSTISMIWNSGSCRYEVTGDFITPLPTGATDSNASIQKYGGLNKSSINQGTLLYGTTPMIYLNHSSFISDNYYPENQSILCTSANGINNFNINGNIITITFDNDIDYYFIKNKYDSVNSGTWRSTWVSGDTSNLNYYRFYRFGWYQTMTQCGDVQDSSIIQFFIGSDVTFNKNTSGGTMTINKQIITNDYINNITCLSTNALDNEISASNYLDYDNITGDTTVITKADGYGIGQYISTLKITTSNGGFALIHRQAKALICTPTNAADYSLISKIWHDFNSEVHITAEVDEFGNYIEPPEENFIYYNRLNPTTGELLSSPGTKIFEIANGVVVFPT